MKRRDVFKASLAVPALALVRGAGAAEFPKSPGLTRSIAQFIVNTRYADVPAEVMALGKKSILDGFGLALAGSVSVHGAAGAALPGIARAGPAARRP